MYINTHLNMDEEPVSKYNGHEIACDKQRRLKEAHPSYQIHDDNRTEILHHHQEIFTS